MLNDLGILQNLFRITYAPLHWKEVHLGLDLDYEFRTAKDKIESSRQLSTKEYHRLIKNLFDSVKDYHVVAEFYSTESAALPFCIQSAEGKYFISYIDPDVLSRNCPISVGDEVITFDDMPIAKAVEAFREEEIGSNFSGTDKALAELYLTTRLGSMGHRVPEGSLLMKVRPKKAKKSKTIEMKWGYTPERILDPPAIQWMRSLKKPAKRSLSGHPYFKKCFQTPHYEAMKRVRRLDGNPSVLIGSKKSMLPPLGKMLWEEDEDGEFYAYLFSLPNGRTGGYLRLATYEYEEHSVAAFLRIMKKFENEADVLVIDQQNNPGGSFLYLYALLSMLTDRPLKLPMHRIKITQEDVYLAATEIPLLTDVKDSEDAQDIAGISLDCLKVDYDLAQSLLNSFRFIVEQWKEGKQFTDFHYLYGIEEIKPHPEVQFSKPILVLVNSLAFSCGDFFPAILQDNNRATIMGTRTAGAGGYVEKISFLNLNGISEIDLTASYAERSGERPIENFGVTPDIFYEVSAADLQSNYSEYVTKILEELRVIE